MRRHAKAVFLVAALCSFFAFAGQALAAAPTATIDPNPTVHYTTIEGTGTIDPGDQSVEVYAEYTTNPGEPGRGEVFLETIPANAGPTPVSYQITGLHPGTEYFVRLDAWTGALNLSEELPLTTLSPNAPSASADPVTTFSSRSAHLSGSVNPEAPAGPLTPEEEAVYETSWHFQCTPGCPGSLEGTIAADGSSHTVEADASGLLPSTHYEIALIAKNAGQTTSSAPVSFTTAAEAPTVETLPPTALDGGSAWLAGSIDAKGQPTTYHFEYGTTTAYGSRLPATAERSAGSGQGFVAKSLALTNLPPSTTFHYRVLATNATGTEVGGDMSFTTGPASQGCGNEALRAEQGSTYLPECRAYELVSPARKFGYPYGSQLTPISELQISPDGEHLTYSSWYPLPTSLVGSEGGYAAQRSTAGWTANSLFPAPGPHQISNGLPGKDIVLRGSTPDGRTSVYFDNTTTPGPTLAIVRADGSRQSIAMGSRYGFPRNGIFGSERGQPWFAGISADGKHVIFADSDRLLPGLPAGSEDILYEWEDDGGAGVLRVVDRDNGPSLALLNSEGVELGGSAAGVVPRKQAQAQAERRGSGLRHAISADGSRVFFQSPAATEAGGGPVYLRADATETTEISAPEPDYTPTNPPTLYQYLDAATDGHIAYFWANGDLTAGAPTTGAIYSYEPGSERIELIGAAPEIGGVPPTALASDDGTHLYYEEGNKVIDHSGGTNRVVSEGLWAQGGGASVNSTGSWIDASRGIRVDSCPSAGTTPNGRFLVFSAREGTVSNADHTIPLQVYRYDAQSGAPARPIAQKHDLDGRTLDSGFPTLGSCQLDFGRPAEPRLLSDDGQRVFFTSAGSYASGDSNHQFDAYEWHGGQLSLLSSGKSPGASLFQGTDAQGRNAFLVTTQPLVGWDIDQAFDLYNARIEGGFPEPPSPPEGCEGEDCQGPAGSSSAPVPASSTLAAAGNHSARKHAKKKRKKAPPACRRKGKVAQSKKRCQAKQAHKRGKASSTKKATGQGRSK